MDGVERVDEDICGRMAHKYAMYTVLCLPLWLLLMTSLFFSCFVILGLCSFIVPLLQGLCCFYTYRSERSLPEFDSLMYASMDKIFRDLSMELCKVSNFVSKIETCQCAMHVWSYVAWTLEFGLLPVQPCAHTDVPRLRIEETNLSEFSIFK